MKQSPKPDKLDSFDKAILEIIQMNNKCPQRAIAERVGLSAAAVQRRIAAMEKTGLIQQNSAVLAPHKLGVTITAIVDVCLTDERIHTVDAAKALFLHAPEVQQCYYVTGGISFILIILAQDMPSYEEITRRLFATNEHVASYRSLITLDRVKTGSVVPIPKS